MDKRVLIVGEATSFIVTAVTTGLQEAGFECNFVDFDFNEISHLRDKAPIIFLYLDENTVSKTDALVYVRDICMEEERLLFLVGYSADVEEVRKMMPREIIGGIFERPLNVKVIAEKLNSIVAQGELEEKKKHILVVDDSGSTLRAVKSLLGNKYHVSMVNSATNAITFLATNLPNLILLDYEMPVCSGPQMLEMIRAEVRTNSIPVMFLTGKGDKESVKKVLALKPEGYMLKSMPPEKIMETVDAFFETKKGKQIESV